MTSVPHEGETRETRDGRSVACDVLLIAWIALIGADRIDFLGGTGPFMLTPFLVLTPFVVIAEAVRRQLAGHPVVVSRTVRVFCLLLLALLVVVCTSVFASGDTAVSASRAALLACLLSGAFAVVLLVDDRARLSSILANGAVAGITLFAVFDVLELLAFLGQLPEKVHIGPGSILLSPFGYAGLIPRVSGAVFDPNRAGFVLLVYLFVLVRDPQRTLGRRAAILVGAAMVILTISRSAILAVAVTGLVASTDWKRLRGSPRGLLAGILVVVAGCLVLLASPRVRSSLATAAEPFSERLSLAEGSSRSHVTLLERGIAEATANVPRAFVGLGYGSSHLVLQDIFPANRYANFHSLYTSMFAESGVFALLLTVALLGVPIVRRGAYRPLMAGAAVFSVFYQATTEPLFWVAVTLAWFAIARAPTLSLRHAT